MKKIFLILTLMFFSFWSLNVFAWDSTTNTNTNKTTDNKTTEEEKQNRFEKKNKECEWKWWSNTDWTACTTDDITNSNFQFDTSFLRIKEWTQTWATSTEKLNYWIWTLIEKLMIWLSILALVLMTIWAWFMITSMWDDQKLSTWKNILKAWIMWLVIALMAYPIMSLVRFVLYR